MVLPTVTADLSTAWAAAEKLAAQAAPAAAPAPGDAPRPRRHMRAPASGAGSAAPDSRAGP
eukprot:4597200-Prymnesium_polylepis.1